MSIAKRFELLESIAIFGLDFLLAIIDLGKLSSSSFITALS